ncbi:MAG TPA: family 10 glycosylhydrolase [Fimbriimonadaceae bacterium]|nr:family 10 glycosylhydrolase [Fimbriimonadaceae bacterium]
MTLALIAASALMTVPLSEPPSPAREFRGVWVATVDNIDWPSRRDLSTSQQQRELLAILDRAQKLRLNAIVFQVRPSADALYKSELEPWSEYLTGTQGKAPDPEWDPLSFAVEEAHRRGLELHAWFNPYRAWHPAAKGRPAPTHVSRAMPRGVVEYGRYQWMDPGDARVQDQALKVMIDVVRRYDVDGVHIDDYFYPYPIRESGAVVPFGDDASYLTYQKRGGRLSRADWRRRNTDQFVQRMYQAVKQTKKWVKVGISPFGIYRPGVPEGIQAGIDTFEDLYANSAKWLKSGWCDYFSPQLYWAIDRKAQSYTTLLDWWIANNPRGRHLWPGNYTTRVGEKFGNWSVDEIIDQIDETRKRKGATGNLHFSMRAFKEDFKSINTRLAEGVYAHAALVPASPWLDDPRETPAAPVLTGSKRVGDRLRIGLKGQAEVRFWTAYALRGGTWRLERVQSEPSIEWRADGLEAVAVAAIDRAGIEGKRTVIKVP